MTCADLIGIASHGTGCTDCRFGDTQRFAFHPHMGFAGAESLSQNPANVSTAAAQVNAWRLLGCKGSLGRRSMSRASGGHP